MKRVDIYTDGACWPNPGHGGWGALLVFGDRKKEIYEGERNTTNNRMDIMAAIQGFKALKWDELEGVENIIHITTSNLYVKDGIEKWAPKWKKRGWKRKKKGRLSIKIYGCN